MKKVLLPIIGLVILVGLVGTACLGIGFVRGSGNIVTKEYDFKDFTAVEASSAFAVNITRGDSYSVVVSTHENIIEHLDVVLSGGTVKLRLEPASYSNTDLKAEITMPELTKLKLSGASSGNVSGFASGTDFDLELSGASRIDIDMETGMADVTISGASRVNGQLKADNTTIQISGASRSELNGSASELDLEVSGASQASLVDFAVQSANLNVSGASRASVTVNGTLDVNVSGASSVDYYGSPALNSVSVTGASSLNKK